LVGASFLIYCELVQAYYLLRQVAPDIVQTPEESSVVFLIEAGVSKKTLSVSMRLGTTQVLSAGLCIL
jgi:hypothetical protein